MVGTNDFQNYAEGSPGSNLMSLADYEASTVRQDGVTVGIADETLYNRAARQSAAIAKLIGDFIAATGLDCLDDGNDAARLANFQAALPLGLGLRLAHGECRLSVVSGTQLKLSPFNGCNIIINGVQYQIPGTGTSGANTGVLVDGATGNLADSTHYYVSVYNNSGVLALAFWSAATYSHMPDTTVGNVGIEVISSSGTPNSAHTLVGMIYTTASGQFSDADGARYVSSWFNRRPKSSFTSLSAPENTSSPSFVELNASARNSFLSWSGDTIIWQINGNASGSSTVNVVTTGLGFDGTTAEPATTTFGSNPAGNGFPVNVCSAKNGLSDGLHYATILGEVSGGTGTWAGNTGVTITIPM